VTLLVLAVDGCFVAAAGHYLGIGYAVPLGVASVVAVDWHLIPPTHESALPGTENLAALGAYLVTGTLLGWFAALVRRRAEASEQARSALAEEQAALRRVATLVAHQTRPDALFGAVAKEARQLLGIDIVSILRYGPDHTATVMATTSGTGDHFPVGTRLPLDGDNSAALVLATGQSSRVEDFSHARGPIAAQMRGWRVRCTVGSPIVVADHLWGVMIGASTATDPIAGETEERMEEFTELVATAISNTQARLDLQASRARIVAKADLTRRQLERDLHDGAQQRLVSLALELQVAKSLVSPEPEAAEEKLSQIRDGVTGVLEELREVSRGIHPSILSAGGLRPALSMLARRSAVPVELRVRGDLDLPEDVEVGSYYLVAEALTNAAKHAQASSVLVEVERTDGVLTLCVADDGVGGADPNRGSGLVGLADRVEALGGRFEVHSPARVGTTVRATVPLPDRGHGEEAA